VQTYAFVASYRFVRTGRIGRLSFVLPFTLALAFACLALPLRAAQAGDAEVARGKYLVSTNGCTDCHTPGHFFGKSDEARYLGGSDVGCAVPGLGVFVGPNLTPDNETGLGKWSTAEIVAAFTTGKAPDGRMLAPPMPWREYSRFTKSDAEAIAVYLKSLPPVQHQVPGPFSPTQTPTTFVMSILPGEVYAHLPHPAPPPPSASDTK
jgi:mono/diheme cytochrome c family protein